MNSAFVEFIPRHFEKALDMARAISTFANLEFTSLGMLRLRVIDPAKVIYMDFFLGPEIYKCDREFSFGLNLNMFYKLIKSLDSDTPVEMDVTDNMMKIDQSHHFHTLVSQEIPYRIPNVSIPEGALVKVSTKTFQKHIRSMSHIAPAVEISYDPNSDSLFLEGVNSMYRTLYCLNTEDTPNPGAPEYKKRFQVKFVDMATYPGLGDMVTLILGDDALRLHYNQGAMQVNIVVSAYTEG
jgi:hypothetical protein